MSKQKSEGPATPECDKLASHREERLSLQRFMEWLLEEKSIHFGIYQHFGKPTPEGYDDFVEAATSKNTLIMEYLEIDEKKLEEERRALLDWQRKLNEEPPDVPSRPMSEDGEEYVPGDWEFRGGRGRR